MSTTVLPGLTSFEKIGSQWIFGGASNFSNLLAPWASGSRSLILRAGVACSFQLMLLCMSLFTKNVVIVLHQELRD